MGCLHSSCPACQRIPARWRERERFESSEHRRYVEHTQSTFSALCVQCSQRAHCSGELLGHGKVSAQARVPAHDEAQHNAEEGHHRDPMLTYLAEGELLDLIDEFSDGRIQFAFLKVKDPNTSLPKNVLIAWVSSSQQPPEMQH